ncbi:OsmC family protein [Stygiolobus caldivivus]|uniref:Peroxiredoxin n=1 Tax=Stygiolobus caldivivus TaxID=2824673 RepID=A0A8D5U4I6_9CREN|nr:OsmC family protein [Stygiolobus caldivivus]BCU69139.1 peroxiredoxin [Stygiolobus caldivivus]
MMIFTAEGELEGDHVKITSDNTELNIGLFGSDYPTPEEILLTSALSCLMLTVYYIAREKKLKLNALKGYIEGTLDPKGFQGDPNIPPGFLEIKYEVEVSAENRELLEKVLEESERRCPLKDTLTRSIKVDVKWKII